jgi:predicted Zn-dependent protease with MMP-like domain
MRMTRQQCERIADHETSLLLAQLPSELGPIGEEVLIIHEWRPVDPTQTGLLGLFEGPERDEVRSGHAAAPPVIRLFLESLRDEAGHQPAEFRTQVRLTLLHELGHYLGLDEDELAHRGLA